MLILAWARTYGINYVIVRPTNNYGVNQYVEKLVPKSIKYLSIGRKIPLHNKGTPVRTWLHAADTARAILTILESGACNEVFNISGNYEDSNLNVVTKIINTFDSTYCTEDHINLDFERAGQDVRYSIDDSKLRSLGWENKRDFDKPWMAQIFGGCKNSNYNTQKHGSFRTHSNGVKKTATLHTYETHS